MTGDSAVVLPQIVEALDAPALFWLDGHFSDGVTALGDAVTPIEDELAVVLDQSQPAHVVLVDDARLFVGAGGYPTLDRIRALVSNCRPEFVFSVADDIIRIHERGLV